VAIEWPTTRVYPCVLKFVAVRQIFSRIVNYLQSLIFNPRWVRGYCAPFDMWRSSPYTGHATHTHTHTHARTHAFLPWLMGHWHKLPIQCPLPPHYHPPIVVFAIKKESTGQKKNLPRKKIARYKGRNSPRERTMITTGWEWRWITLGNETDVFRSQSMAWMVIPPYCGGNFTFFPRNVCFCPIGFLNRD